MRTMMATAKPQTTHRTFSGIGEYCASIRKATLDPHSSEARTMTTASGSDGGFLVPNPVVDTLTESILARSYLLSRCTVRSTRQAVFSGTVPDESVSTSNGGRFGGFELPTVAEDATIPYEWPKLRQVNLAMTKSAAIVPVTNELFEDGGTEQFLDEIVPKSIAQMMERQISNGLGAAEALGIVRSPSLIVQAIEATQTIANTPQFIATNAAKMVAQVLDLESAAFYVHPDILTAALLATVSSNEKNILTPPDADAPFGRLATRPIFPNYFSPAVGTVGDFMLASMSNYLVVAKAPGTRRAMSVHARFLQDESLFRFTIRWNGAPMLGQTVTPAWSSTPKSHYVALAARS